MRKQYHFWPSERGLLAWDVGRLIQLSNGLQRRRVPLREIREIDEVYWFDDEHERPTCRAVLNHMRLIQDVDTSYPIILGADGRVMDGMHRVAKALLQGRVQSRLFSSKSIRIPTTSGGALASSRISRLPAYSRTAALAAAGAARTRGHVARADALLRVFGNAPHRPGRWL